MGFFARVYRGRNDFDFPFLFRPIVAISSALFIASVVSLIFQGLNLSIDFAGGAVWEVPSKTLTVGQASDVLGQFGKDSGSKVQEANDADGNRILRVQASKAKDVKESQDIANALAKQADIDVEQIATNTVGPTWGTEITKQAVKSLIIFLIVIALYISWQLEWRMSVGALVGVLHDIVISVGIYSLFGFEVTPATVISFLTILGFSLYDTIVVYDRVKENIARFDRSGQYTFTGIMRRSLNQVMMRSVNTTIVSLLPVLSMLIIGAILFDQPLLRDFSLALFIGIFLGAFSSLFIASPVVVWLKEREDRYARIRRRARDKGVEAEADHPPVVIGKAGLPPLRSKEEIAAAASTSTSASASRRGGVALAEHPPEDADGATDGEASDAGADEASVSKVNPAVAAKAAQYQRNHPPRPRKGKQGRKR